MMRLELKAIDVTCVIGDLPEERVTPQRLAVDVALTIPARAAETDDLADTVDYATLTADIRAALVAARCRLIERAAKVVAEVCLRNPLVESAEVRVLKTGSVPHLGGAVASLRVVR